MGQPMKRSYYTVLPSQLLSDIRLTATSRTVYAVIENLTHKTGECYASNEYIMDQMAAGMSERTLQRAIELLESCGYIKRSIITAPGQQNERRIMLSNDWKNCGLRSGGGDKNDTPVVTKMSAPYNNDEKQRNKIITLSRTRVDEMFIRLWDQYPTQRRGSKQKAYDAFIHTITQDKIDPESIIAALPAYVASEEVQDKRMVQYLSNWLENRGYEAEYTPAKPKPQPQTEYAPPVMPPLGVRGLELWNRYRLGARSKDRLWDTVFERIVNNAFKDKPHDEKLKNIRIAGHYDNRMAGKIYYLGANGDISHIEREFAAEWWKRSAYPEIRHGVASLAAKHAEWQSIVDQMGLDQILRYYDPTDVLDATAKFWEKMGWK